MLFVSNTPIGNRISIDAVPLKNVFSKPGTKRLASEEEANAASWK